MRRAVAIVSGVAIATVMTVGLLAQAKPNFTGKWTRDAEKSAAANPAPPAGGGGGAAGGGGGRGGAGGGGGRAGGGGGGAFELKQDATSLTRITEGQNGPTEVKYLLDGQPHDVTVGRGTAKVTAKVDGATIVLDQSQDMNGTTVVSKTVYSMDGDWLVIASTRPGQDGASMTTKNYYKKG